MISKANINKLLSNKYIVISILILFVVILYLIINSFYTNKNYITEPFSISGVTKIVIYGAPEQFLQISELGVYAKDAAGNEKNIVGEGTAESSTQANSNTGPINVLSTDGKPKDFTKSKSFHSGERGEKETWTLKFKQPYELTKIIYYNRADNKLNIRANNSTISLFDNSDNTIFTYKLNTDLVQTINLLANSIPTTQPILSNAQTLIINTKNASRAQGGPFIQISQLAVYAMVDGKETNIAPKGKADANSKYNNSDPRRAIDNVLQSRGDEKSIFHSGGGPNNTWTLVLDKPYEITKIVYYNRNEYEKRALGNELQVFNATNPNTPIFTYTLSEEKIQTLYPSDPNKSKANAKKVSDAIAQAAAKAKADKAAAAAKAKAIKDAADQKAANEVDKKDRSQVRIKDKPVQIINNTIKVNNNTYKIINSKDYSKVDNVSQIFSSFYDNSFKNMMLDSPRSWAAKTNGKNTSDKKEYVVVDLGKIMEVAGIVTQGRPDAEQAVTKYTLHYSNDNLAWQKVENGKNFDANKKDYYASKDPKNPRIQHRNSKVGNLFARPIVARYIKIIVEQTGYYGHMSMRAGVLAQVVPANMIWRYANGRNIGETVPIEIINTHIQSGKIISRKEDIDNTIIFGQDSNNEIYFTDSNSVVKFYIYLFHLNKITNGNETYILSYSKNDAKKVKFVKILPHKPGANVQISNIQIFPIINNDSSDIDISKKNNAIIKTNSFGPGSGDGSLIDGFDYISSSSPSIKSVWQIDLNNEYDIDTIKYYNNKDNSENAANTTLFLLNYKQEIIRAYPLSKELEQSINVKDTEQKVYLPSLYAVLLSDDKKTGLFFSKKQLKICDAKDIPQTTKAPTTTKYVPTSTNSNPTQPLTIEAPVPTKTCEILFNNSKDNNSILIVDKNMLVYDKDLNLVYNHLKKHEFKINNDTKKIEGFIDNTTTTGATTSTYSTNSWTPTSTNSWSKPSTNTWSPTSTAGPTTTKPIPTCGNGNIISLLNTGELCIPSVTEGSTTTQYVPTTTKYNPTTTKYNPTTTKYVPTTSRASGGSTGPTRTSTTKYIPSTTLAKTIIQNQALDNNAVPTKAMEEDLYSKFPDMSQDTLLSLINNGVDILSLLSNKNTISDNGIKMNSDFKSPSTNIYQRNFSGTSNVYSPYLYYNKSSNENIVPKMKPRTYINSNIPNMTIPNTTMSNSNMSNSNMSTTDTITTEYTESMNPTTSTEYTESMNPTTSTEYTDSMYPPTTSTEYTESMYPPTTTTEYMYPPTTTTEYMYPPTTTTEYMYPPTTTTEYMYPPTTTTEYMYPSTSTTEYMYPPTSTTEYNPTSTMYNPTSTMYNPTTTEYVPTPSYT